MKISTLMKGHGAGVAVEESVRVDFFFFFNLIPDFSSFPILPPILVCTFSLCIVCAKVLAALVKKGQDGIPNVLQ